MNKREAIVGLHDLAEPTERERRAIRRRRHTRGRCFELAMQYVLDYPYDPDDLRLVHGITELDPGRKVAHAWVELRGGKVFDGAQQCFFQRASYYRVLRAVAERRYTVRRAAEQMRRSGFYGPWHSTAGAMAPSACR